MTLDSATMDEKAAISQLQRSLVTMAGAIKNCVELGLTVEVDYGHFDHNGKHPWQIKEMKYQPDIKISAPRVAIKI